MVMSQSVAKEECVLPCKDPKDILMKDHQESESILTIITINCNNSDTVFKDNQKTLSAISTEGDIYNTSY